jgi:ATP-dependent helicase/nuclease subunit B
MFDPASPSRHFLNPARPLLPELADRLLPARIEGPLELGGVLLVAPTRQAGRRLREFLAHEVRARGGTAVLSMRVVTPNHFLNPPDDADTAGPIDVLQVWAETLAGADLETLPALMPGRSGRLTFTAALEFGRRVQKLRDALVDGDLDLTSAAAQHPEEDERPRWQELARLEADYRKGLASLGLSDPCDAKRDRARTYEIPEGVERIVLAAVPDPSPLALKSLQRLIRHTPIEVWIHAAPAEADLFDPWGRPLPVWGTRFIGPETDPEGWIERHADPKAVSRRVAELLAAGPKRPDLAFGMLDPDLSDRLQDDLHRVDRKLYDPNPVRILTRPPARLIAQLADARSRDDGASLRALWRNPDILAALTDHPARLLRLWDAYAATHLPGSAASIDETLREPELRAAWDKLRTWIQARTAVERLAVLEEIYSKVNLDPEKSEDRFALRVADEVSEILQDAARREQTGRPPEPELVLQLLRDSSVDPLRVEGDVTAEGWLELAYHPAPALLLIGLQEGQVPGTRVADPFLPDGLRAALHLRSDRDWLARDAYLFHTLIRSRAPGAVRILCMKRDSAGGPVHPSRLLFQCSDAQLLARAELLFSEPPPPDAAPHAEPGLILDLNRPKAEPLKTLSVTGLRAYLQCPTRFYLRNVLRMHPMTDDVREPDSAAFGSLIHAVLQHGLPAEPAPLEQIQTALADELNRQVRELYGSRYSMAVEVLVQNAHRRLRAAAELHHSLLEEGWRILATEQACERELNGLLLRGKIDRIDHHPEKGLRILDYKTSDQPTDPEKAHLGSRKSEVEALWTVNAKGRDREWVDLQLPAYRWLAETQEWYDPSSPLEVAYFQLPKAVTETAVITWPEEREQADSARAALAHIVDCIQKGIWGPPNEQVRFDDFENLFVYGVDGFKLPE